MQLAIVAEVAFVTLGYLLLRTSGFGHRRLVIKKRHERVPEREHEQEKRNRRVHKEPAVQPMMQFDLQIEHAPLVAPCLNFFHAIAVRFGDAKFDEPKCVLGKTGVAKTHPVAALRGKVRQYLSIQEIEQRSFRINIAWGGGF